MVACVVFMNWWGAREGTRAMPRLNATGLGSGVVARLAKSLELALDGLAHGAALGEGALGAGAGEGFLQSCEFVVDAASLQSLELGLEVVGSGEHAHGFGLSLHAEHLFFHAVERAERGRRRHSAHHIAHRFVRLRARRARLQRILLTLRLRHLALEQARIRDQFIHRFALRVQVRLHRFGVLRVRLSSRQRFSRQVLVAFLHRQLRALIPIISRLRRRVILRLKLFLRRHHLRRRLPHLDQIPLHLIHRLIENLLRVFRRRDQRVGVRRDHAREPAEQVRARHHGASRATRRARGA